MASGDLILRWRKLFFGYLTVSRVLSMVISGQDALKL